MTISLTPIGYIESTRSAIRDDDWDAEAATIRLDSARFDADALAGLQEFSHVEVIYHLDRVPLEKIEVRARRPRSNPSWPEVGIFAQRGKNRPNRLGLTIARVLQVSGTAVTVAGLDAIDGTPVLDLKPYMAEFGPRGPVAQPSWSTELMSGYWGA